jgi:hypothetical protein
MPHQLAAWGRRIDGPPRAARVGDATHGDAVSMGRVGTPHQWAAWGRRIDGPRGVAVHRRVTYRAATRRRAPPPARGRRIDVPRGVAV